MSDLSQATLSMWESAKKVGAARTKKKFPELYMTNKETGESTPRVKLFSDFLEGKESFDEWLEQSKKKAREKAFEYAGKGLSAIGQGIGSAASSVGNWVGGFFGGGG